MLHSLHKYLLSAHQISGTVLQDRNMEMNKTDVGEEAKKISRVLCRLRDSQSSPPAS